MHGGRREEQRRAIVNQSPAGVNSILEEDHCGSRDSENFQDPTDIQIHVCSSSFYEAVLHSCATFTHLVAHTCNHLLTTYRNAVVGVTPLEF